MPTWKSRYRPIASSPRSARRLPGRGDWWRSGWPGKPGRLHDWAGVGSGLVKALVKARKEPGLVIEDVPTPAIGRDDVLIRVLRTGVCGTDLHIYDWDGWAQANITPPLIIGHEFVGEIVALGSEVQDLGEGDLVSGEGHLVCGRCRNCMAGRRVQCARTKGVGVNHPGAFAEFIALPATNVWRHPPGIDLDVAAIFDPFGNAVHTALTFPVLGEDVLITGAGPIGLMA